MPSPSLSVPHLLAGRADADEARRAHVDYLLADMHARVTDGDRAAMSTDVLHDEETGLPV
jgi:hypothetical protein